MKSSLIFDKLLISILVDQIKFILALLGVQNIFYVAWDMTDLIWQTSKLYIWHLGSLKVSL